MAANINPIFLLTSNITWGTLTAANIAKDGTGSVVTVFTAGLNGARVEELKVAHLGTNIQTVLRIFLNNGSANTVATNNTLIKEVTIPSNIIDETIGQPEIRIPFSDVMIIPAGYKINVVIGTTIAAGIQVTAMGGNF